MDFNLNFVKKGQFNFMSLRLSKDNTYSLLINNKIDGKLINVRITEEILDMLIEQLEEELKEKELKLNILRNTIVPTWEPILKVVR